MLLKMVYKKILKNKWMFLCMLIGFILSTMMLSSIPIYTQGVTQKVLIKDLENYQTENKEFPASFSLKVDLSSFDSNVNAKYERLNNDVNNVVLNNISLPKLSSTNTLIANFFSIESNDQNNPDRKINTSIITSSGIEDHVSMTYGKIFSSKKENDLIEVIATEGAMEKFDLTLNTDYTLDCNFQNTIKPMKIRVVGVFKNKTANDSFWSEGLSMYDEGIVMDYQMFRKEVLSNDVARYVNSKWYAAFDYHKINTENLNEIMYSMNYVQNWANKLENTNHINALDILSKYNLRQKNLKATLIVLEMPIIVMLVFYIFMVSQLIIEQDKKEIAVLKSRGASNKNIILAYFLQGVILSVIALLIGPILGFLLCNLLGSTNGFMEFVHRSALPLKMNLTGYYYALIACAIFIITMLMPVYFSSQKTIIMHSREGARVKKKMFIQKYYIDIVLFLISFYGYYLYKSQQKILSVTKISGMDVPINPFLFGLTSIFIISLGLIFQRIFPYLIMIVFKAGRGKWKPAIYTALINLSRSGAKNNFLIMFLIITVSTGIFSANSARTINTNIEERENYSVGADLAISAKWEDNQLSEQTTSATNSDGSEGASGADNVVSNSKIVYKEPDYNSFATLSGIERATKVTKVENVNFADVGQDKNSNAAVSTNTAYNGSRKPAQKLTTNFMAIIPCEFGTVAWFRTGLLKYHWYNYLNLLTKYPTGILVSSNMAKKNGIKLGDDINVDLGNGDNFKGVVLAFIDYWPSYNPFLTNESEASSDAVSDNLIVGNFRYLQSTLPLRPYEIWLKKKPGASSTEVYNDIKAKKLEVVSLKDSSQNIITEKNDPIVQGTNGSLTLGFLVNLLITLTGFIIFWILTIKGRTYQFGILRAMGLSLKQVVKMIFSELLILSISAMFIGICIGNLSSKLFVPLLQITGSAAQYVPPFKVTEFPSDYYKLYTILFIMIIAALIILRWIISKININQALKLGED